MSTPERNESDVQRLLRTIDTEYQAAALGLSGLALGTSMHSFITRRMERQGRLHDRLRELVGDDEAAKMLNEAMEKGKEGKGES